VLGSIDEACELRVEIWDIQEVNAGGGQAGKIGGEWRLFQLGDR
jgi:hypothetical protein